jgi:FkbM family methyltransferase
MIPPVIKRRIRNCIHSLGYDIINREFSASVLLPEHLGRLLKRLRIDCVLDVGAHLGEYHNLLRRIGYRGRVISFEPNPDALAILTAASASDPQWTVHGCALGDLDGQIPFHITRSSSLISFLTPDGPAAREFGDDSKVARTELVPIRRLDTFFADHAQELPEARLYLKMDTQGYDLNVLRGVASNIHRVAGLQSELSLKPIYSEMPDYLQVLFETARLGFEVTGVFPVTRDRAGSLIEVDCVMQRAATPAGNL